MKKRKLSDGSWFAIILTLAVLIFTIAYAFEAFDYESERDEIVVRNLKPVTECTIVIKSDGPIIDCRRLKDE